MRNVLMKILPPPFLFSFGLSFGVSIFMFPDLGKEYNILHQDFWALFEKYYLGLLMAYAQFIIVLIYDGIRYRSLLEKGERFYPSGATALVVQIPGFLILLSQNHTLMTDFIIATFINSLIVALIFTFLQIKKRKIIHWVDIEHPYWKAKNDANH
jgi:hypothetical protein